MKVRSLIPFASCILITSGLMGSTFNADRPQLSERACDVFAFGEFLFWKAKEEGLAYALQSPAAYRTDPNKGVFGKISQITPHFEPGFRLGLNWSIPHDQWDLTFTFTSYQSFKKGRIPEKTAEIIWPYFLDSHGSPTALSAKARWDLKFNTIDLDVKRAFFLGKKLSLQPFIGFQAAWIEQKLIVKYIDVAFDQGSSAGIRSKNRNLFEGYGMNAGGFAKYHMSHHFSFFGKFAAALLLGTFDIAQFERNFEGTPRLKLKETLQEVVSQIQMQAGVVWEMKFHSNDCYLNLYAAFEEQVWFNQNQINRLISSNAIGHFKGERGDLTFGGITMGATLGF